jgi:hypothetical protein
MLTDLRPMNWNGDPDITNLEVLNTNDEACLEEMRAVLARHGKLSRFGVTLLHSHFKLAKDEVFLEQTDPLARTLLSSPVRYAEIRNQNYRPTVWRFDGEAAYGCSYCPTTPDGKRHSGYKESC